MNDELVRAGVSLLEELTRLARAKRLAIQPSGTCPSVLDLPAGGQASCWHMIGHPGFHQGDGVTWGKTETWKPAEPE